MGVIICIAKIYIHPSFSCWRVSSFQQNQDVLFSTSGSQMLASQVTAPLGWITLATTGRRWWVVLILRYFKVNRMLRFFLKFRFLNDDLRLQQKNERLLWLDKSRFFLQRLVIWRVRNSKQGYGMTNRGWDEEQKGRWTIYPPWN